MPKIGKIPVFFSRRVEDNWDQFWAAISDEEPMDLRQSFERAAAVPQDEMATWDIELADGVSAYVHPQIPGFAFVAKIFTGYIQVVTWTPIHGSKGELSFEWKPKKKQAKAKSREADAEPTPPHTTGGGPDRIVSDLLRVIKDLQERVDKLEGK